MAAEGKVEGGNKKMAKRDASKENIEPEEMEEEDMDFSDPEDFVDDVSDQGKTLVFRFIPRHIFAGFIYTWAIF